jgi:hypothetical protein
MFTPDRRWHRELVKAKWHFSHRIVSRRTIPLETQLTVWRMSRENDTWDYKRIEAAAAMESLTPIQARSRRPSWTFERAGPP